MYRKWLIDMASAKGLANGMTPLALQHMTTGELENLAGVFA
jgi:hypothetical protein